MSEFKFVPCPCCGVAFEQEVYEGTSVWKRVKQSCGDYECVCALKKIAAKKVKPQPRKAKSAARSTVQTKENLGGRLTAYFKLL